VKITGVEAVPVSVPTASFTAAPGTFTSLDYAIVVVSTDEGIEGVGEISTLWDGKGRVQCAFVDALFRDLLLGEDPCAIERIRSLMETALLGESALPARAAIEMALFDIKGKALGIPVYELLGGRTREQIVLSRSISMADPDEMAAKARDYIDEGYRCVKVKVGLDVERDYAAVGAVREAIGPHAILRVDANAGWSNAREAIRNIKRLEQFGLHSVEQPIPPGNVGELLLVRTSVNTPIMVDESVWHPRDAWRILVAGAADLINVYVAESGGLLNASLIFSMAEMAGVRCVIGAMPEFGIGTAAAVHLGVAVANLHDPCDACGVVYQITDVVNETVDLHGGAIRPSDRPGLGVTLDWDAIERYRAAESSAASR
jgi:L-alanine-DL-glutamate epimerase-like enolase superfamily enzyme